MKRIKYQRTSHHSESTCVVSMMTEGQLQGHGRSMVGGLNMGSVLHIILHTRTGCYVGLMVLL